MTPPSEEIAIAGSGRARPGFFYGWVMAGVCTVAYIGSAPGQTVVVSQFNTAFREELGLSASALSGAYLVGTVGAAMPLVLLGRASDRFGPRRVMAVVALLLGLACAATGLVRGLVTLTVAFFFLRLLGQGGMTVLSGHALALWFERRLGTMNGLKLVGAHMGFAVVPAVALGLIEAHGWRLAYPLLGLGVWALMLPVVLLLARDRPEELGQRLDGDPPEGAVEDDSIEGGEAARLDVAPAGRRHVDPAFTLRQAMGTWAYWILAVTMMLNGLIGTALIFHAQPLLEARGLEPSLSASVLRTWSFAAMLSIFPAGWVADRLPARVLLPVALLLMALSSALAFSGTSVLFAHASMAAFGLTQALTMGVGVPTVARYFGRAHHGAIRGSVSRLAVVGTGLGPLALGASLDAFGSLRPGLHAFVAVALVLAVGAAMLKRPAPPRREA